jgi:DNA-binding response OmpR family regulator
MPHRRLTATLKFGNVRSSRWDADGLGEHGHVVMRCSDGNDGLHQALTETPDLLLVDLEIDFLARSVTRAGRRAVIP